MQPTQDSTRRPRWSPRAIAGVVAAVAALAGGGAAIAATALSTPEQEREAILGDAAERLGITPEKLSQALEQAYEAHLDARVEDGTLDEEAAERLKEALEDGDLPLLRTPGEPRGFGRHGPGHHGPGAALRHLDAAASYLGLEEDALRERLRDGETLAEIAKAQGKTTEGLKQALTEAATAALDAAVADGRLTEQQKQRMLERLGTRLDALIEGELRPGMRFRHHRPPLGDDRRAPGDQDGGAPRDDRGPSSEDSGADRRDGRSDRTA